MTQVQQRPVWETFERVDLSEHIGDITDKQVDFFQENGWVEVKGFLTAELCDQILERLKERSGLHTDVWPDDPAEQAELRIAVAKFFGEKGTIGGRESDPWLFNYTTQPKLGKAAARLLREPAVKIYSETTQLKLPQGEAPFPIDWHQDFPNMATDRATAVQMWVALRPLTADMGCMVHLSGSHREPPLGMLSFSKQDATVKYPYLFEKYTATEPHDMAQGDVYFHHPLTWHRSGPNLTNKLRWGMSSLRVAADSLYTGQKAIPTDGYGLEPFKPFDHPNFPTVWDERVDG